MVTLASTNEAIEFVALVDATKPTKGNLSAHMKRLEDAGWVKVEKEFVDRKPVTRYRCTAQGRQAVRGHLLEVERMLKGL